jgi:hypothetical protein
MGSRGPGGFAFGNFYFDILVVIVTLARIHVDKTELVLAPVTNAASPGKDEGRHHELDYIANP